MEYQHKTLEQRLTEFYGVPLDQVPRMEQEEIYWGDDRGAEKLPNDTTLAAMHDVENGKNTVGPFDSTDTVISALRDSILNAELGRLSGKPTYTIEQARQMLKEKYAGGDKPNDTTFAAIDDAENGKNMVGPFDSTDELFADLNED